MELSVQKLDLASATEKIPENGVDPYRMIQVHDYLNVSFLRMDPAVKAASKEVITVFSMAYPELLKAKFFVNVSGSCLVISLLPHQILISPYRFLCLWVGSLPL